MEQRSQGTWRVHQVPEVEAPFSTADAVLSRFRDLTSRERRAGVLPGQWFMARVGERTDADVLAFFASPPFRFRAKGTQRAYAFDLKVFFTFLDTQQTTWRRVTHRDFENYEFWRRRDQDNPHPVKGTKFNRELAAIRLFYDFQVRRGVLARTPLPMSTKWNRYQGDVSTPVYRSKRARSSDVKWLTPTAYRQWARIGLGGYLASGLPQPSWKGRNDGRNLAFAELLWASGLRLREAATLLLIEVPRSDGTRAYVRGRLSASIAKNGASREFWTSRFAISLIEGYMLSTRQLAVDRARSAGRYDNIPGIRLVTRVLNGRRIQYMRADGNTGEASLDQFDASDRRRLFREGQGGIEPMALWLNDAGLPMKDTSWEAVFAAANRRVEVAGVSTEAGPLSCRPHMLRHSFALRMFVAFMHLVDRRVGLTRDEIKEYLYRRGAIWVLVAHLLGHKNLDTTKSIYLEPVAGLHLDSVLNGAPEDSDETRTFLARIAEESGIVHDLPPGWSAPDAAGA